MKSKPLNEQQLEEGLDKIMNDAFDNIVTKETSEDEVNNVSS